MNETEEKKKHIEAETKRLEEEKAKYIADSEWLSNRVEQQRALATQVETEVSERISYAQENAAKFIADMAFSNPIRTNFNSKKYYKYYNPFFQIEESEPYHNWSDVVYTLQDELEEAGVNDKYATSLAAYLCSAYIAKQAIILVGPNANDIFKAFCCALTQNQHGELDYNELESGKHYDIIGQNGEQLVLINNLLDSNNLSLLPRVISNSNIMFIATHPIAEDVQIEPKSLYNYIIPIFTELFVDKPAKKEYVGGYYCEDFESYTPSDNVHNSNKFIKNLPASALTKSNLSNIWNIMKSIYPEANNDDLFLFGAFQYLYATMNYHEYANNISNNLGISKELKKHIEYLTGEL